MAEENPSISARHSKRSRWNYYRRLCEAYLLKGNSHLTFWHGTPQVNFEATYDRLGQYYMLFEQKANYPGPFDEAGIPLLDYHGSIGKQYNPIAIAQYGLGNYNWWKRGGSVERRDKFFLVSDWLVENLETNRWGIAVWNHHFNWEYREILRSPWYSSLSQGQGISVLIRAYQVTGADKYLEVCQKAFQAFELELEEGGVRHTDEDGNIWLEETIVHPPTHILNGFIWAIWGIHDYWLYTQEPAAGRLIERVNQTLKEQLSTYDSGFWSMYEHSGLRLRMLASSFYHRLHIVQLQVMYQLYGDPVYKQYAERWQIYQGRLVNRIRARFGKALFKLLYY